MTTPTPSPLPRRAERALVASVTLSSTAAQLRDATADGAPFGWTGGRLDPETGELVARWLEDRAELFSLAAHGVGRCTVEGCWAVTAVDGLCSAHALDGEPPSPLVDLLTAPWHDPSCDACNADLVVVDGVLDCADRCCADPVAHGGATS